MEIQNISFKSSLLTNKISQSNIGISPIVTSPTGDTVEISTKKDKNNRLKYTLIGIGALLGIVVIAKHKSIAKFFKKTSVDETVVESPLDKTTKENGSTSPIISVKNKGNISQNTPSTLVPLEKITNSKGEPFIENCSEGYQLWHFVSPEFLEKFISLHQDLSEFVEKTGLGKYRFYRLKFIKEDAQNGQPEFINFVKAVKAKTKIDLCGEFKHYRFIGQKELNVIRTGKDIEQGKYLTLSPNGGDRYNIVPNKTDYRITFKNTDNLVNHLAPYHDTAYKTWTKTPYSYKDVEKVEKRVNGKWQEVEFAPKDKMSKVVIVKSVKSRKKGLEPTPPKKKKLPAVKTPVRVIYPPTNQKALAYFNNRNMPIEPLVYDKSSREAYSLIQRYRNGEKDAVKSITSIKNVVDNASPDKRDFGFKNKALERIAFIYRLFCKSHFNEPLEFSPLEHPRLFRTIGESEYQALMEDNHIVSKLCNDEEVMVTNNPNGVANCARGKKYFVHFKDKINFDTLASYFFSLDKAKVPNVRAHNMEEAEYYIQGGYNIEDVEKIIDPLTKKIVYSSN